MMSQYIGSVCILHCGGEQEHLFIEYLEKALTSFQGPAFTIEYTKFHERQAKDIITFNDAVRYQKEKLPMIVLISKQFFDLMWITSHKQGLLNIITSYSTKNCLHVWLDVNDNDVRSRSVSLCRTDGYFRKIIAADSANLSPHQVVVKIQEQLIANGDGKFDPLNNYSVDNEVDEMRRNYERAMLGLTEPKTQKPVGATPKAASQTRRKTKNDPYKNALRMANMTTEEIQASGMLDEQIGLTSAQPSNNVSKKSKKNRGKRKGDIGTIKLLTDLTEKDRKQICSYLDKGSGANWKQLAETFSMSPAMIKKLADSPSNVSQTGQLIDYLVKDKPELEISEFSLKCKQIMRTDVQSYISTNILDQ